MIMDKRQAAEKKGRRAEWLAAWTLRLKGYRILKMRHKTPVGEIDIIAKKGITLVCVEVKARKKYEDGLYSITHKQQQRIQRVASLFASDIGHIGPVRFDAMIKGDDHFFVKHLKAAWRSTH